MNFVSHVIVGCIFGILLFFQRQITMLDIFLFLFLSTFMDIDHIINLILKRPKDHLRSFVQEPFGILLIGIPVGLVLYMLIGDILYFWLCLSLYFAHLSLDYACVFEAYPLDPFSKKIVKKEGSGIVIPAVPGWKARKKEFPKTILENYLMLIFAGFLILIIILYLNF